MGEFREAVTKLLAEACDGSADALNRLMAVLYDDLHARAVAFMQRERADHTLQPTALVHEAYLRLVDQDQARWKDRGHFLAIAATMMRRVLINHARDRAALKREGAIWKAPLLDDAASQEAPAVDLVALDEALQNLSAANERLGRIVEMRFFGGMSIEEIAAVLDVDPRTVKRGWRAARTILFDQLGGGAGK